jgi:hypothetical protein
VAAAASAAALATGVAVASKAAGGCYAGHPDLPMGGCPVGTVCNRVTGMCDRLPCHGYCPEDQHCDEKLDACVAGPSPAMSITRENALPPGPPPAPNNQGSLPDNLGEQP